ncbi:MAG: hypothetical protein H0V38_01710 [Sporichthyaceae bacterium]|nr:hypothetical protein [Sporichthyaceae bacterium]
MTRSTTTRRRPASRVLGRIARIALLAPVVAAATVTLAAGPAQAAPPDDAAAYLVSQLTEGDHVEIGGFVQYGPTIDVGLGLLAADSRTATLAAITDYVTTADSVDEYVHGGLGRLDALRGGQRQDRERLAEHVREVAEVAAVGEPTVGSLQVEQGVHEVLTGDVAGVAAGDRDEEPELAGRSGVGGIRRVELAAVDVLVDRAGGCQIVGDRGQRRGAAVGGTQAEPHVDRRAVLDEPTDLDVVAVRELRDEVRRGVVRRCGVRRASSDRDHGNGGDRGEQGDPAEHVAGAPAEGCGGAGHAGASRSSRVPSGHHQKTAVGRTTPPATSGGQDVNGGGMRTTTVREAPPRRPRRY